MAYEPPHLIQFYFLAWQVSNPATGEVIVNVPCMGRKETNDAISSASDAFKCTWLFIL